jgi:hypothetical protein
LVYRDVFDSLAWPQLLKAWRFALRPTNLVLGGALLFSSLLVLRAIDALLTQRNQADSLARAVRNAFSFPPPRSGLAQLLTFRSGQVLQLLSERPWQMLLLLVPICVLLALFGGAIARNTAELWTQPAAKSWPITLALSIRKLGSGVAGLLGPLLVVLLLLGLVSVLGFGISVPFAGVVAGGLFVVPLLLTLVAALLLVAYCLSLPMLLAGTMFEGTDSIDVVQRSLAYAFAKPVRLALYWALLIVQGAVLVWCVGALVQLTLSLCVWAITGLANNDVASAMEHAIVRGSTLPNAAADLGLAGHAIAWWSKLAQSLPAVVGVSYACCAASLLYGTMRRVCDGQDASELFDPVVANRVQQRTQESHARDDRAREDEARSEGDA